MYNMSILSTSFGFSLKWKRKDLALGHFFISLEQALKTHYIYLRHCIVIVVCMERLYGGTRWIEDDCSATFSEYIFLFPACLMISHWLTKNAELNSVF